MFRLVFGILGILGIAHAPPYLKLHVVPGCRFIQHESQEHDATRKVFDTFLFFFSLCIIIDRIGPKRRCVCKVQDLCCGGRNKNGFTAFSSFVCGIQFWSLSSALAGMLSDKIIASLLF